LSPFLPPSKQISFNKNLTNNDGLLTNHISQRQKISFQEANLLIRGFVDRTLTGLKNGDKIKIKKVGELYLDPEGNIQFIEEESNDFLLDSFGLQSLRALPIQRDTIEDKIQDKLKSGKILATTDQTGGKAYWRAAAVVFFLLSGLLFLDQKVDRSKWEGLQYSVFSASTKAESSYQKRDEDLKFESGDYELEESASFQNEDLVNYVPAEGESSSLWIEPKKEEKTTSKIDNTRVAKNEKANGAFRFHVMGGCFSNYDNATSLTKQLQTLGYPSQLLGSYKNLHAVSYGSFASREEAVSLLKEVKENHNASAWLLEKSF
jgi:cell division septation protein DedD